MAGVLFSLSFFTDGKNFHLNFYFYVDIVK